jgi:hypothetical protein
LKISGNLIRYNNFGVGVSLTGCWGLGINPEPGLKISGNLIRYNNFGVGVSLTGCWGLGIVV